MFAMNQRVSRLGCAAAVATVIALVAAPADAHQSSAKPPAHAAQTIYDPALKVTWLANADLAATHKFGVPGINKDGSMTYHKAVLWIEQLNGHHWLGHRDWTLPITPTPYTDRTCSNYNGINHNHFGLGCTVAPLASLYSNTFHDTWPNTAVPVKEQQTGLFFNFQPYLYWTNAGAKNAAGFHTFSFNTGWTGSNTNEHYMYLLPMIPGNVFNAKPDGGKALVRVAGGSAVFEPGIGPGGNGISWLADADLATTTKFGLPDIDSDGSMEESTAVKWLAEMNGSVPWLNHTGWTFPTDAELTKLYDALKLSKNEPVVKVASKDPHGFSNIQPYLYWSCAGKKIEGTCHGLANPNNQQWSYSFGNGFLGTDIRPNLLYVEPYYPH